MYLLVPLDDGPFLGVSLVKESLPSISMTLSFPFFLVIFSVRKLKSDWEVCPIWARIYLHVRTKTYYVLYYYRKKVSNWYFFTKNLFYWMAYKLPTALLQFSLRIQSYTVESLLVPASTIFSRHFFGQFYSVKFGYYSRAGTNWDITVLNFTFFYRFSNNLCSPSIWMSRPILLLINI